MICKTFLTKSQNGVLNGESSPLSKKNASFLLGNQSLDVVSKYKYLGIVLDQFINFNVSAEILADAGSRALGTILNKYRDLDGLGYNSFQKLYHSCVCPILDYASGVWGAKSFDKIDHIQNRAIRAFLGVHNYAPNMAIQGDMGWTHSSVRRRVNMVRLWNKLINLDPERLTKKIFLWDYNHNGKGWAGDMKDLYNDFGLLNVFEELSECSTEQAWALGHANKCLEWKNSLQSYPKLRTYVSFKKDFYTEPYVKQMMNKRFRSVVAQLRSGILPLEIELGRWRGIEVQNRTCKLCDSACVEDEAHFIFDCDFYKNEREGLKENVEGLNFQNSDDVKFKILMQVQNIVKFAKYVSLIYQKRKNALFG